MHNIELMFGFYLDVDNDKNGCITLKREEHTTGKDGKPKTTVSTEGYYSTFGGALMGWRRKAIKRQLAQGEGLKLDQAIDKVKALDAQMRALIVNTGLDCGETKLI